MHVLFPICCVGPTQQRPRRLRARRLAHTKAGNWLFFGTFSFPILLADSASVRSSHHFLPVLPLRVCVQCVFSFRASSCAQLLLLLLQGPPTSHRPSIRRDGGSLLYRNCAYTHSHTPSGPLCISIPGQPGQTLGCALFMHTHTHTGAQSSLVQGSAHQIIRTRSPAAGCMCIWKLPFLFFRFDFLRTSTLRTFALRVGSFELQGECSDAPCRIQPRYEPRRAAWCWLRNYATLNPLSHSLAPSLCVCVKGYTFVCVCA